MNLIKTYIQSFLKRAGSYVFAATVISRVLSFLASWIALQLINNKELGVVLYSWNIITFILPFVGLGLHQSLIRYGALVEDSHKKSLLYYVVKNGTFATIFLSFVVSVFALLYPFEFEKSGLYIALLTLSFIPYFLFSVIQIQFRLEHNNKAYAFSEVVYNIILVVFVFLLSVYFQERGYLTALILAPVITTVVYYKKLHVRIQEKEKLEITNIEFWKYGFFGGLSNVSTILLFAIDILLIGSILNNAELVTAFRYVSILPLSLLFVQRAFITTDFVAFTERIYDIHYIKKYCKSYMMTFLFISILICATLFMFSEFLLHIFSSKFVIYKSSFRILTIGICGILIFRGLFGNLLSSIGMVKMNYYITSLALLINIITNYYLIPKYEILGAAITSAAMMWFTGILSAVIFYFSYKKQLTLKNSH